MVQFCCIEGCGNRSNRDRKHFFRIPNVTPKTFNKQSIKADIIMSRRKQWLLNINREDLKNGDGAYSEGYIRVCSDHFVSGKPSLWSDVDNIDWAPTVNMIYDPARRRHRQKSKVHRNRGLVNKNTALKRRLKVEELELKACFLKQLLTQKSDSCEEVVTLKPIIHKITVDCIVKEETDADQFYKDVSDKITADCIAKEESDTDQFYKDVTHKITADCIAKEESDNDQFYKDVSLKITADCIAKEESDTDQFYIDASL